MGGAGGRVDGGGRQGEKWNRLGRMVSTRVVSLVGRHRSGRVAARGDRPWERRWVGGARVEERGRQGQHELEGATGNSPGLSVEAEESGRELAAGPGGGATRASWERRPSGGELQCEVGVAWGRRGDTSRERNRCGARQRKRAGRNGGVGRLWGRRSRRRLPEEWGEIRLGEKERGVGNTF